MPERQEAKQLLIDLMAWRPGEDLTPLIRRAVDLLGPKVVIELPRGAAMARETLIDDVEDWLESDEAASG
jgi:hypothetical protein